MADNEQKTDLNNTEDCTPTNEVVPGDITSLTDDQFEVAIREAAAERKRHPEVVLPVIADYQIVREIGRGGMGVVYEAIQRSLNRPVALKVLPALMMSVRPESSERFRSEAASAARLQHPHIVPIHDYGQESGCHYYAMELIDGWSLSEIIRRHGNHEEQPEGACPQASVKSSEDYFRDVARWIAEVADGLQFAHERGVIHRDIKPSNLILDRRSGRVMITDFGLAKDEAGEGATQTGHIMGTWRYMSPEQMKPGSEPIDARTDVYSLGVTMYELLTFQPAFAGPDGPPMIQQVIEQEPRPARRIDPRIPRVLETITNKAMAKELSQRYATAAELRADLLRFLTDEPIAAQPPSLHQRVLRVVRRHRLIAASAIASLLFVTSVWLAAAYYDQLLSQSELRARAVADLVTIANSHMDAGSYHRAVAVYSRALEYDPSLAYVYAGRAGAYSRTGQLDRAVADLTQAIERTTLRGRLYYRRGVLYRMQGDSRSALEDFGRAIEASPSLEEARILRYSIRVEFPNLCPDARLASEELEERSLPADEDYWNPLVKYLRTGEGLNDAQAAAERAGTQKLVVMALAEESRLHHNTLIAQEWYRQCLTQAEPDDALHIYCQWGLEQCR